MSRLFSDPILAEAVETVALVEETHPCFALNDVSAEYIPAREKLLSECEYAQDQAAFAREKCIYKECIDWKFRCTAHKWCKKNRHLTVTLCR